MTDLRTISPDELPELGEIPEDLRTVVFSPNGPLQSLPYQKLMTKLIAADLAKATKAALDGDLAHPENSVALVFSDPDAASNGWYRKLGASGAGSWSQFEELARNSRLLAAASAQTASDAAAEAAAKLGEVNDAGAAQVAAVQAEGGTQVAAVVAAGAAQPDTTLVVGAVSAKATATLGSTTPDTTNAAANVFTNGEGLPRDANVTQVSVRMTNTATLDIYAVNPLTRRVVEKAAGFAVIAGVNNIANPFGGKVIAQGLVIAVRRASGTGVLRTATGGFCLSTTAGDYAVGDQVPAWTVSTVQVAIAVSFQSNTDAVTPRLRARETDDPSSALARAAEVSPPRTRTLGSATGTVGGNTVNSAMPALPISGEAIITSASVNVSGAAAGYLSLWTPANGTYVLRRRLPVTLVSGLNTITIPRWHAPSGSFLCYERIYGNNLTYASGGSYFFFASGGAQDIGGTSAVQFASGFTVNIAATVELATRASYRANRAAVKGPTQTEFNQFRGVTTPPGWALVAPFTVSNGLTATGAGGWDAIATYQPNGLGWSSVNKRRFAGIVTITDPASIIGICTQPRTTSSGSGGMVAEINGAANELRLYHWTGTAAAGTQVAQIAMPALTAGRRYMFEVTRDHFTVTVTLTDLVTNVITTLTYAAANASLQPRAHGRAGVMHRAGTATWESLNFVHDYPRISRAVVFGDSNYEGLVSSGPGNLSWVNQLDALYGGVVNASRAGESSVDMAARLSDLTDFRPRLAMQGMATNETTLAVWRLNTRAFIDAAEGIGAEPILVIPPPQVAKQALMTSISDDIIGRTFGDYRWIDLLGALSNNNDRLTWNPAFAADLVHMNAAGQTRALAQSVADIPDFKWGQA